MGKHSAADGDSADPIVAAALGSRAAESHAVHSADEPPVTEEGPVGWPGAPAPGGGGLGWPADAGSERDPAVPAEADGDAMAGPGAPPVRRSWRRLFGAGRVA
ncbi:MAG: uncharacterized protein JWR45_3408 [Blastococcus sp.]|nr:uncharacterized protein [Blastococcus sp.]